jgi:hypothetical protein
MPKPLIEAARRLAELLDLENAALRAMDIRRATSLLAEKTAAVAELSKYGDAPSAAVGAPHRDVVSIARRLDAAASENRRLLERAIVAQQRVIGIVVRAAAAAVRQPSYGAGGRQSRSTAPMAYRTRA